MYLLFLSFCLIIFRWSNAFTIKKLCLCFDEDQICKWEDLKVTSILKNSIPIYFEYTVLEFPPTSCISFVFSLIFSSAYLLFRYVCNFFFFYSGRIVALCLKLRTNTNYPKNALKTTEKTLQHTALIVYRNLKRKKCKVVAHFVARIVVHATIFVC